MINTKLEKILASRVIQNIVFWIFYALIPFLINWSRYRVTADMLTDLQYYLDCALLGYINNFFLMPKFFDKKKYTTYFLLVLSLIWGYNLVTEEIATYLSPNYKITTLGYIYNGLDFILFTVAFASGRLVRKYLHQEKLITQLKEKQLQTEINFLKSQINPHLLFNTLNTLYSYSLEKSPDTPKMILKLSEIMRYMLYQTNKKRVPLSKEITYIKSYVELQLSRIKDRGKVDLSFDTPANDLIIAPMLLISFVENAFKYSMGSVMQDIDIAIHLSIEGQNILFTTKNKYSKKQDSYLNNDGGIGIKNTQDRLDLIYPNAHQLNISDNGRYFTVTLKLSLNND